MSLPCPKCGGKSKCTNTRKREGYTYRRLKCIKGHAFSSVEVIVEDSRSGIPTLDLLNEKFTSIAKDDMRKKMQGLLET